MAEPLAKSASSSDDLSVLTVVPSRGEVRMEFAVSLQRLAPPVNATTAVKTIIGETLLDARNGAVAEALELEAEFLFFLDDDVLCGPQTLRRLFHTMRQHPEWDVLSAIVPMKNEETEPCIYREEQSGPFWDWTFGETFEVDACGMACCLIRTSIFEKIKAPWFTWHSNLNGNKYSEEGEDIRFCRRVREVGGKIAADGGVFCGHMTPDGRIYQLPESCPPVQRNLELLNRSARMTDE